MGHNILREYDPTVAFDEPFTLEEWLNLGYLEDVNARPNNLTYPIHPALDFRKWALTSPPLTASDREVMEPALRLASALLMSPASITFMHTLIYDRRELVNDSRTKKKLEVLPEPLRYNKELRSRVEYFLNMAHKHCEYTWRDEKAGPPEWAAAEMIYAYTQPFWLDKVPNYGYGSAIRVNSRFLESLHLLNAAPLSTRILNHQLRLQLLLAVTLCHELMHALETARNPEREALEPYWGDQALNELGLAWEDVIFNGNLTEVMRDGMNANNYKIGEWPLTFCHFPAPHWFPGLVDDPNLGEAILDRKPAKGSFTTYFVPMEWLSNIQQQASWDRCVRSNSTALCYIPRNEGYQLLNNSWEVDPNWSPAQSSEGRWPGDERGRVFRNRA